MLIVVVVIWVYTYVKTHQTLRFTFLDVNLHLHSLSRKETPTLYIMTPTIYIMTPNIYIMVGFSSQQHPTAGVNQRQPAGHIWPTTYMAHMLRMAFTFSNGWKKVKGRIAFCDT